MRLSELLKNSALLLKDRPSIFMPKLATNLISSFWMIMVLITVESGSLINSVYLMLFFPVIMFLGLVSPVIVAEIVKNKINLKHAVQRTIQNSPKIFLTTLLIIIIFTAASIPMYAGLGLFLTGFNILFFIVGIILTFAILISFSFSIYFLPVTLTESGPIKSIISSSKASNSHRTKVATVMIFSFILLGVAALTTGPLRNIGLTGFVLGRAISSIVGTYTMIISPKLYAELSD